MEISDTPQSSWKVFSHIDLTLLLRGLTESASDMSYYVLDATVIERKIFLQSNSN